MREAYLYLLERGEGLADEFQRQVSEALRAFAETAHHYHAREDSIRRCSLKKFPHGIMYELQEDRVIVYAGGAEAAAGFWKKRSAPNAPHGVPLECRESNAIWVGFASLRQRIGDYAKQRVRPSGRARAKLDQRVACL